MKPDARFGLMMALSIVFAASSAFSVTYAEDAKPAADAAKPDTNAPYKPEAVQHYNRGYDLHQAGHLNQAIAEYKAALAADDRVEEAYTNLGLIYAAQRNYAKAMDSFKKSLQLKPTRPNALNGLGTVLYAKNKYAEAMEKWKQAIEIDPNFASAYYNMGNALETEKEYEKAVEAYVKAISINPNMADAYYRVGSIYAKQKHPAQANILLAKAVELDPAAEFVHDAKRTLQSIESELRTSGGSDEPEVKMNIMAPPSPSVAPDKDKSSAAPEKDKPYKSYLTPRVEPGNTLLGNSTDGYSK